MSIIVIRDGVAARVAPAPFALERVLQEQIATNPSVLPLHEVREGAELVAVVRELPVASGFIDLVGFDAEGEVYVIETKLARNPDRRTVVAQAFDYGAALWADYAADPAAFVAAVDGLRTRAGAPTLAAAFREARPDDESAAARALERVADVLNEGAFHFVIPMDRIEDGLKDLVRYVNANSRFTVYLVELEQYRDGELIVVVPRLFGAEGRKTVGRGAGPAVARGRPGSADEFEANLDQQTVGGSVSAAEAEAVRALLRLVTAQGAPHNWYAGSGGRVSVSPRFPATGLARSPFTLRSDGVLTLNRHYVAEHLAWQSWLADALVALGQPGNPKQFASFRATEWAPHATRIIGHAVDVLRAA